MEHTLTASEIVDRMIQKDSFSQWLGIERIDEGRGHSKIKMTVTDDMLNGFRVAHGGVTYSFADSALAFASNSHGRIAVSMETSISHIQPVFSGDTLIANAQEASRTNSLGIYNIRIINQNNSLVALFKGTVFIKKEYWT